MMTYAMIFMQILVKYLVDQRSDPDTDVGCDQVFEAEM